MNGENIALFDLDASLADYSSAMLRDLSKTLSTYEQEYMVKNNITLPHLYYHMRPKWLKARTNMISRQTGWWRDLEPIPSGFVILDIAVELGYDINILTKGSSKKPDSWKEKVEWCNKHILVDHKINIAQDKGLVYGKVLFDDYPPYIEAWLKWRPRGLAIMPETDFESQIGFEHPNVIKWDNSIGTLKKIKSALRFVSDRQTLEPLKL